MYLMPILASDNILLPDAWLTGVSDVSILNKAKITAIKVKPFRKNAVPEINEDGGFKPPSPCYFICKIL